MAKIVYTDFTVYITAERSVYLKYSEFFQALSREYGVIIDVRDEEPLCRMMMWRIAAAFVSKDIEYVFARDADALVTYREAHAVNQFVESGLTVHGLHDNPAHSVPLLGGLCGFKCEPLRNKYGSYYSMLQKSPVPISGRGTDQDFLNRVVYNDFLNDSMLHYNIPHEKTNPLYLSDLCISFIGAAGVNEMETLRYLRDNGIDFSLSGVGKYYPRIFYWL